MVRKYASTLVMLGLLYPGMATALGLGELTLHSFLNEPLDAEVDLLETSGLDSGQIKIRLAAREDFNRAGVERAYFLTSLKFEVEESEDAPGRLIITSTEDVREPFLNFLIEVRWPSGRILREYTVLLDPPVLSGPASGMTARAVAPVARPATTKAPETVREQAAERAAERAARAARYGSDAASVPVPGSKYLVQRDETLWGIARRARPADASIQQTMLDIQRLNPEAFIGNNINQLKAGYVLRLPTTAELSDIAPEQAEAVIAEQERNWHDNVASIDARRLDASEQSDSSGVAGSDAEEGRLQIAGVDGDVSDSGVEGDLSARLENQDRVQRDNQDLQARLDSMDQQVDMLKRLVTLKDDQIAALQNALTDAGQTLDTGMMDAEEGTIEAIVEPLPEPATADTETAAQPPAPVPAPVERGIVDMLMDYLIYIVGLLVLALAAVGWQYRGLIRRKIARRSSRQVQAGAGGDADDEFAGVELVADAGLIVDEFAGDSIGDDTADEPLTSFSAPDEEAYAAQFETGDALAEADIYIAYGRFPQAVDLLKTAISMEPLNTEYRVKLMEACVEMVESSEFQQQYADLQVIEDEHALNVARAMLDAVDGGEVWLEDLPEPTLTAETVAAAKAAAEAEAMSAAAAEDEVAESSTDEMTDEPALEMFELDLEDGGLDLALDDDELADLSGEDDDLELELDDDGGTELELEDIGGSEDGASDELELLEFEAEPAAEELADEPELEFLSEPEDDAVPPEEADSSSAAGEFELEDLQAESTEQSSANEEPEEIEMLDLSFDGSDEDGGLELATEAEDSASLDDLSESLDLSDGLTMDESGTGDVLEIDLELDSNDSLDAEPEAEQVTEFDLDALEDFGEEEALSEDDSDAEESGSSMVFATDGDEIATKMDLARAYMDMGDHEGARNILDEVLQEGSDGQKQEAQSLLDSID